MREGLGEGGKRVLELQYYFKVTYTNAKNSLIKGRLEIPQLTEKSIWRNLVQWRY